LFRTGWLIESVLSASLVVLILRTRRPFYTSKPGRLLVVTTLLVALLTLALPYSPLAKSFGLAAPPLGFYAVLVIILLTYALAAECLKRWFFRPGSQHKGTL
jgi:Mg2+-importing ATPase